MSKAEFFLYLKQFWACIEMPTYACLGALVLYVLNRSNDKQPFSIFLAINIDVVSKSAKPSTIIWDMLISSSLGALVVTALVAPTTIPQAIISGLGMTGILAVHTKQASE